MYSLLIPLSLGCDHLTWIFFVHHLCHLSIFVHPWPRPSSLTDCSLDNIITSMEIRVIRGLDLILCKSVFVFRISRPERGSVIFYYFSRAQLLCFKKMHCGPFNTPQNLMEGYRRSLLAWLAKGLFLLFLLQLAISRPCKSFLFLRFSVR